MIHWKKPLLLFFTLSSIWGFSVTPKEALSKLMAGNKRYTQDALQNPNRNQERRQAIVAKQLPFATIVGCSDSRVAPEIIFDQGVGDLFVVRVAGNVIGPLELDSIEYSVLYLGSVQILVMGHENCGAVDAVIQKKTKDIEAVAALIEPAVKEAKETAPSDLLRAATKINALRMQNFLQRSPVIKKLIKENKIEVRAAYYNLQTGAVELL